MHAFKRLIGLLFSPLLIPLFLIGAVISIPYFKLYPDRHRHLSDFDVEVPMEKPAWLIAFRQQYAGLTFWQRFRRAFLSAPSPKPSGK